MSVYSASDRVNSVISGISDPAPYITYRFEKNCKMSPANVLQILPAVPAWIMTTRCLAVTASGSVVKCGRLNRSWL